MGLLSDPVDAGTDIVYASDVFDLFVLSNHNTVRRVSIVDGSTTWTWAPQDDVYVYGQMERDCFLYTFPHLSCFHRSLNLHSRIVLSGDELYVISLSKSFASYTPHITVLNAKTGIQSISYPVPGSIQNGLADLLVLDYSVDPSLLWVEKGNLKRLSLQNRKVTTLEGGKFGKLNDVGLGEFGMFVAMKEDETAVIFRVTDTVGQDPKLVWTFKESV